MTDDYCILSQYRHLTDRQTERRTDGRTELRQQYRALHYMQSRGNEVVFYFCTYTLAKPRRTRLPSSSYKSVTGAFVGQHHRGNKKAASVNCKIGVAMSVVAKVWCGTSVYTSPSRLYIHDGQFPQRPSTSRPGSSPGDVTRQNEAHRNRKWVGLRAPHRGRRRRLR